MSAPASPLHRPITPRTNKAVNNDDLSIDFGTLSCLSPARPTNCRVQLGVFRANFAQTVISLKLLSVRSTPESNKNCRQDMSCSHQTESVHVCDLLKANFHWLWQRQARSLSILFAENGRYRRPFIESRRRRRVEHKQKLTHKRHQGKQKLFSATSRSDLFLFLNETCRLKNKKFLQWNAFVWLAEDFSVILFYYVLLYMRFISNLIKIHGKFHVILRRFFIVLVTFIALNSHDVHNVTPIGGWIRRQQKEVNSNVNWNLLYISFRALLSHLTSFLAIYKH